MATYEMLKVSIASLNIKGLGSKKKREEVRLLLRDKDVLLLQEAHGTEGIQFKLGCSFQGYNCFWSHYKSNSRGVVTMVNKRLKSELAYV